MPGKPCGASSWLDIARDWIAIIGVLRCLTASKSKAVRLYPETVRLGGGITWRSDEQHICRRTVPSGHRQCGDADQHPAIGQRSRHWRWKTIFRAVGDERFEVVLDHRRPNVAGGTAKKCFGGLLKSMASPSESARSGLLPRSSR